MNFVIDLLLLGIIILTAFISAKYGFVRTLVELVGFVLIILIINLVSIPLAEAVYGAKIEKDVLNYSDTKTSGIQLPADDFIDSLPDYLTQNDGLFTISKDKIKDCYNKNISKHGAAIAEKINEDVIKPATVRILAFLIAAVLFTVLNVIVHILAKILNGVINHTFAKGINQKLGFIFGLLKGALICLVICLIMLLYTTHTGKSLWIFSGEAINNSYIVRFFKMILPDHGTFSYVLN